MRLDSLRRQHARVRLNWICHVYLAHFASKVIDRALSTAFSLTAATALSSIATKQNNE